MVEVDKSAGEHVRGRFAVKVVVFKAGEDAAGQAGSVAHRGALRTADVSPVREPGDCGLPVQHERFPSVANDVAAADVVVVLEAGRGVGDGVARGEKLSGAAAHPA